MTAGRKRFVQFYVLLSMKQKPGIKSSIHDVSLFVKYQKRETRNINVNNMEAKKLKKLYIQQYNKY